MSNDFVGAILQIAQDKGLSREVVIDAIETALTATYKRTIGPSPDVRVRINDRTGELRVLCTKRVVIDVSDSTTEVSLKDAQNLPTRPGIGELVDVEIKGAGSDLGRIAAQTARQVIMQKINDAERDRLFEEYVGRTDDIVTGIISRHEGRGYVLDVDKVEAVLAPNEQVQSEQYRIGQRLKVYVLDVQKVPRGMVLNVSRTHRNLVKRLFELEVPEVFAGTVEIKAVARDAGIRTKVAVAARQDGIDPVGACIGQRGIRIQNVVNELQGEKVDVTQWSADSRSFVAYALRPATVLSVTIAEQEKTAVVVVPDRELSLAIGKDGQNARLSARLTGWKIDIKKASDVGLPPNAPPLVLSTSPEPSRPASKRPSARSKQAGAAPAS